MTLEHIVILILLLTVLYLGWRGFVLTRRLRTLSHALRDSDILNLPAETVELSDLFQAIDTFSRRFSRQLASERAEHDRMSAVLEQISDGILLANESDEVEFANPAAHRLLDASAGKLVGGSVAAALRYHQLIEAWQESKETQTVKTSVFEVPRQRGFLQIVVAPDQFAPGGSLLLVQDLTRLRQLETARRDFISNLSHEIRTPLASLKALTETLQDGAIDDPPAAERFLARIVTEVDALTQMAQELLDLSRIESGQAALELESVSPHKILERAAERMRTQAERADLQLTMNCPSELPSVHADITRIEQVLVNLIHNAIKFTSPGGSVSLSAEVDSDNVRFAVEDTGIGIPSRDISRIFERFYKTDRARASRGTGLGLSISKHLIETHGGKIWAESVEGRGSTFYFSLPLAKE